MIVILHQKSTEVLVKIFQDKLWTQQLETNYK